MPTPVDVKPGDTCGSPAPTTPPCVSNCRSCSKLPPRYVVWGDGTSDEMCLGLLTATVDG